MYKTSYNNKVQHINNIHYTYIYIVSIILILFYCAFVQAKHHQSFKL